MATVADAVRVVAQELIAPPGRVKHHSRRLQDEGILPLAIGTAVPHMSIEDVAALIITVAVDRDIKSAAVTVADYRGLFRGGLSPDMLPPQMQAEGVDAVHYLACMLAAFAEPDGAPDLAGLRFEFGCNWPEMRVTDRDGHLVAVFSRPGELASHWRNGAVRRSCTITALALFHIMKNLEA
ncbi:hypothetical protein [Bosea sp. (in: a-proteobacteria)]|jgi:hypothetical protein|uniref:hypothetical protein n=1 Tax=Bosea sp. (in: a-proteobacteria) TaxID=1871050 RepID=UPI003F716108